MESRRQIFPQTKVIPWRPFNPRREIGLWWDLRRERSWRCPSPSSELLNLSQTFQQWRSNENRIMPMCIRHDLVSKLSDIALIMKVDLSWKLQGLIFIDNVYTVRDIMYQISFYQKWSTRWNTNKSGWNLKKGNAAQSSSQRYWIA